MKMNDFVCWLPSILTVMLFALSNASAQTVNPCDKPNELPSSFFEVPVGPQGTWKAFVSPDLQQSKDLTVPVAVDGAGAIQGPVGRRGMRLGCGLLRNRSEKTVVGVQLRWLIVREEDRIAISRDGYAPATVVLAGHTPELQVHLSSASTRRMDFSTISFAEITKPLTKDGILSGDYCLLVGISQVRFADGSVWNADPLRQ